MKERIGLVFNLILLSIYFLIGFTPYLDSIDKVGTQFLFISLYNIFVFSYIIFNKKNYLNSIKSILNFKYFYSFLAFVIISFLSFFNSINETETLVQTSIYLNYFFSIINIFILINYNYKFNLKCLPFILFGVLVVENIWIYKILIEKFDPLRSVRDQGLRAFTGNINITAFALLMKIPLVIYLAYNSKKPLYRIIYILVIGTSLFAIFNFGSRGANYASIILLLLTIIFFIKIKKYNFIVLTILLYGFVIGINGYLYSGNDSFSFIERSSKFNNASTNSRLDYYKDAINTIIENPIAGIGSGNWKVKSIDLGRFKLVDYTIPYHVHNDFLEVTAELGIIGFFLLYGLIIYQLIKMGYNFLKKKLKKSNILNYFIFISITVFIIDSTLNFPLARPVIFIPIITLFIFLFNNKKLSKKPFILKKILLPIALIILIFQSATIWASYLNYRSLSNQNLLIAAVTGKFEEYNPEMILSIDTKFPNLSATALPLEAVKANLLINKDYIKDTVLTMIEKGHKANPYLGYADMVKSLYLIKKLELDSAYHYVKKGYYQLPNHLTHFNLLYDFIELRKDIKESEKAYNYLIEKNISIRPEFEKKYVETSIFMNDSSLSSKKNILKKLLENDPKDEQAMVLDIILEIGLEDVENAYEIGLTAEELFKNQNFLDAAIKFEEAYSLNPKEFSYVENAANAYMQFEEFEKSISILSIHKEENYPTTGKTEYLLGLNYLNIGDFEKACLNFNLSLKYGFPVSDLILSQFCN